MANPSHDLLPCPFCGARLQDEIDDGVAFHTHPKGDCWFSEYEFDQINVEQWNSRATPPSSSTAPEVPPFPEPLTLADVDYATNTPASWDPDYRRTWQQLQVAQATIRELRAYARQLRALASRPAEVDDEGLPEVLFDGNAVYAEITRKLGKGHCHNHEAVSATLDAVVRLIRQGQRDAVAADRARRAAAGGGQ